jgi:putative heme-binding domain-containing protein
VGGQTQFGRYRDDWGDWFGGDNSHPIRHIVVDDRYLRRNPFVVPRNQEVDLMSPAFAPPVFPASRTVDRFNDLYAANRFTSACSPAIVRDARLDLGRDGAALVCEPVHNLVHRAMLQQQGCTFRATRHPDDAASEFCASTDTWFRPVAARMGPDGSVWIVDMYRHVIEHPQWIPEAWQAELDLRAGCRQGRIYRVFPKGESLDPVPNLALLTAQELVAQLDHPNGWRRDTAQRLILERREEANIHDLQALLQTTGSSLAKVHALNILALRQRLTGGLLQTALDDADWRVQRAATRLCRPELDPDGALLGKLVELARRAPPPLQLQVALNLGSWNCDEAGEALAELAIANAGEAAIRSAVLTSTAHAETVLARWDELAAADAPDEMLGDLIATATGTAQPDRLPFILDRIATIKVSDQGALFDALARYERAMLRRGITWNSLRQTTSSAEVDVGRAAEAFAAAHAAAGDAEVPTSTRVSALRLLAGGFLPVPTDIDRLLMLLTAQQPIEVQSAVVERIAETGHAAAAAGLFEVWPNLSPRLQQEVITAVASRPAWHELAAAAIDAGQLDATDFDRAARSQLLATADPKLGPRWHALFGGVAQESSADLAELQREVEQFAGDSPRGSELFAKHCATCHRHGEIGNDLGPKLAALSDKSTAVLLTAIVTPNRAIEAKYESYTCITQDGRVYAGMIRDESSQSITLAQPDGTLRAILRADVEDLKSTGVSFMPTGFERELSAKDLADLFAFLRSDGASAR